ncbi:hypothetical protein OIDMADRAFT_128522, partial [Oidiodendron maius Zn]
MQAPTKKFRKGTPKSRNGCITCKIRRIKCDESKPSCKKCSNTGRKCDGYNYPSTTDPQKPFLQSLSLHSSLTQPERRFLNFFYHHTAPILSGCFDSEFWVKLLPQVGHSEPTIQHAMIAVAAGH